MVWVYYILKWCISVCVMFHRHVSTGTVKLPKHVKHCPIFSLIKMAHYDDLSIILTVLRDVCWYTQRSGKLQVFPDGNSSHKDFSMSLSSGRDLRYHQRLSRPCWSAVNRLNVPEKHFRKLNYSFVNNFIYGVDAFILSSLQWQYHATDIWTLKTISMENIRAIITVTIILKG